MRVVTTFNYFISGVIIDGVADPPSLEQLRTATKLELGALFHEDLMEPAVSNMLERLHANGLYKAQLSYHVDFNPGTEETGVYFQIQPDDRARFDEHYYVRAAALHELVRGWKDDSEVITLLSQAQTTRLPNPVSPD